MFPTGWIWIYTWIPPAVTPRTVNIVLISYSLHCCTHTHTRTNTPSLMLLNKFNTEQRFLIVFHAAWTVQVTLCLCPKCLKSFMLSVTFPNRGKPSACVRSLLLNHSDIICSCRLGHTNCGRFFFSRWHFDSVLWVWVCFHVIKIYVFFSVYETVNCIWRCTLVY